MNQTEKKPLAWTPEHLRRRYSDQLQKSNAIKGVRQFQKRGNCRESVVTARLNDDEWSKLQELINVLDLKKGEVLRFAIMALHEKITETIKNG